MKATPVLSMVLIIGLACSSIAKDTGAPPAKVPERPVDLVICLDTSNSMDGLISAAKQKLWDIVNELAKAQPKPHLRVGLYSYGTPAYGVASGYVRKEIDLTDDLDAVYARLTALTTHGGDEYVARVVHDAVAEQPWSRGKNNLKIIVVAGNEPATQDTKFKTADVCKEAVSHGIIVNTIYCGAPADPDAAGWRDAARAADGQFASIDQNNGTVVINTPFDQKLADLSGQLNQTYLAYGKQAEAGKAKQAAADASSGGMNVACAAVRAVAKAGGQYRNSAWDLVDASKEPGFDLARVEKEELPPEMQKMSSEEQKTYLTAVAQKRADLQKEINSLNVQRQKFIDQEMKKGGQSTDQAFDAAMLRALRTQAESKSFRFEP